MAKQTSATLPAANDGALSREEDSSAQEREQLAFTFASDDIGDLEGRCVAAVSRQERRPQTPGRNLRVRSVARSPEEVRLEHDLSAHLPPGKVVSLRLTDNRHTIISVWRGREAYRVRAHRMFSGAEPRLIRALARYVVHNDPRASSLLGEFIARNEKAVQAQPQRTRQVVLRTLGKFHDLKAIFDRINQAFFGGQHDASITWGPATQRPQQRSIKIGSFSVEDRLIRVHPVLDQAAVPSYFVEWIVFHEMLHGKHAIRLVGGRRCFHPPEFLREERAFPDFQRARTWERSNLDHLLGP